MKDKNQVTLRGRVGNDPDLKETPKGTKMAKFNLATHRRNKEGEQQTDWHRIVAFGRQAEAAGKLKKGAPVHVEGRLQPRSYEKDEETRYVTEVVAWELLPLSGY